MAGSGNVDNVASASVRIDGVREIRGSLQATGLRFAIVVSRFNTDLTAALAHSAIEVLVEAGAGVDDIDVVWVPGAFEIPSVLERLAEARDYAALIALGAVIQGETTHATTIGSTVSSAISAIARGRAIPVIDGVVVAPNRGAADTRCLSGPDSRGAFAARAAIEMANVFRNLPAPEGAP